MIEDSLVMKSLTVHLPCPSLSSSALALLSCGLHVSLLRYRLVRNLKEKYCRESLTTSYVPQVLLLSSTRRRRAGYILRAWNLLVASLGYALSVTQIEEHLG